MKEKNQICFVCSGGTCRSFMAMHIMRKLLKESNINKFDVSCYGVDADEFSYSSIEAIKALKAFGITARKQKAKQVPKDKLNSASLVITMTMAQKQYFNGQKNVLCLKEIVQGIEIPDPYGKGQSAYDYIAKLFFEKLAILIKIINKVEK